MGQITLRYWAAAKAAAGVESDVLSVDGPLTVAAARERALVLHDHDADLARVLAVCSVLVDDRPVGTKDPGAVSVPVGSSVEFLPPFAGG
ncbi:MoaD/ThiS family protein [Nocardioides daphniae]|nr:MoaD/ThiS family protein [Nocardioides daphniae]QCC76380.1 MoaD/ThiS family protein [Nocardioides daphniae]